MHGTGRAGSSRPHRRPPIIPTSLALLLLAAARPSAAQTCVAVDYTVSSGLCAGLRLRGSRCLIEYYGLTSQLFGDFIVGLAEDNANMAACKAYAQSICLVAPVKQDYCAQSPTAGVCSRMQKMLFGSQGCDTDADCTKVLREYAPVGDGYNVFTPDKPCCDDLYHLTVGLWCNPNDTQEMQTKDVLHNIGQCHDAVDKPMSCMSGASSLRPPLPACALSTFLASLLLGTRAKASR